ncbi:MAG: hypothetical protein A3D99_01075 [Candidatus Andersenbacteria bacterium RIFCSPHIGHO2_12_FULL_45_11]|uniref:Phosphoheptose isomerase n=1 Tax=Candidatus Andersenbacteria bacterium RIFCSPHIGHO2_12_FULL_45_11 TaxID=1797281 RepID=A0A1G1X5F0_9BACT|nr:MAG: hypothetical protein A3D99_01075 [Candidatus Andersenbacteria bacterium RIFCSPHIGHO2_12_FULL_45_11]
MQTKSEIQKRVRTYITNKGLRIAGEDFERPWGGFFLTDDVDTDTFLDLFFAREAVQLRSDGKKISPKLLVVLPEMRLSWQYHDRRAEMHKVIRGPVAYSLSITNDLSDPVTYYADALVEIPQGTRHRLIGLNEWGLVAEVWQHVIPSHPSDEADNHRLQDDFKRT